LHHKVLFMEKNYSSAEDLKTIRKIMEDSTKFLSLSGFSGLFPGLYALAGACIAHFMVLGASETSFSRYLNSGPSQQNSEISLKLGILALSVLILSIITAFGFSLQKAKRSGQSIWTPVSKRLLNSLFIPLITGGVFALVLLAQGLIQLVIPVFLIFYGLALINAGKFTFGEIFYLGVLEIITGLLAALFPAQGLMFWTIGFGVLHIAYGLFLYRKYEV